MSFPGTVSYEEIEDVYKRFNSSRGYDEYCDATTCPADAEYIINGFAGYAIASTALLASSVTLVVILLLVTHTTGTQYYEKHYDCYVAWWASESRTRKTRVCCLLSRRL